MDARELRPGNNVIYKPTSDIVTVLYTGPKGWAFETTWEWNESAQEELQEIEWLSMEAAEPIPLTPEILEAAGFELIKHLAGYSFWSMKKKHKVPISIYESYSQYYGYPIKHLEYLHQLQNIFYNITGSELQIDLIKLKA